MYIIDQLYGEDETRTIFKDDMDNIFDRYGDGYYKDYGNSPLCTCRRESCLERRPWKIRLDTQRKGVKIYE